MFLHPPTERSLPQRSEVDSRGASGDVPWAARVLGCRLSGRRGPVYYLYVPRHIAQPARMLVSVHGISRNAREHAERFAPLAERAGVVLVAPRFSRRRYGRYQQLTAQAGAERADRMLQQVIVAVQARLALPGLPVYLFGYSGGGQFVHRFAMAYPDQVAAAVIGAAGWYSFPDPDVRYPRGLRARRGEPAALALPDALQVPMTVLVGAADTERDPALRKSPRVDRQQGLNRLERGRRWVDAMRAAARAHGLCTRYGFRVLPDVGHDFTDAMLRGGMGEAAFEALFGAGAPADPLRRDGFSLAAQSSADWSGGAR